jgi:hypothetical protein
MYRAVRMGDKEAFGRSGELKFRISVAPALQSCGNVRPAGMRGSR